LVAGLLAGVALVGYVAWASRGMKRDLLEHEAEGAREVLMPGADGALVAQDRHPREITNADAVAGKRNGGYGGVE